MPQMMPMWWVLLLFIMTMIMISSMAVMSSLVLLPLDSLKSEKESVNSWWK